MFILIRALTYATIFSGFVLIAIPARVLSWSGLLRQPEQFGPLQAAGVIAFAAGAVLTIACVLTFVTIGRGTPFPLDPPRRLVDRGPYAIIRNPMFAGAGLAMSGAALYYGSWWLLGYVGFFLTVTHLFVVTYEEPTLRETFGEEYAEYRAHVGRWWPGGV
jgi:protein-S-isoprenylcysteine O-methyltransferase Ste14